MALIRTERTDDGVVELVLAAPDRGNAIDIPWADELVAALDGVGEDASLSALADRLDDGLDLLDELPVPVVVAVQGWAAGAGMSLALWGDVIVVGEGTRFRTAYNRLGVTADGGMTWQLPRRLPTTVAMDLLFTEQAAREVAVRIAAGSTGATRVVKALLRASPHAERRPHLDAERDAIAAAAVAPDGQEGISAFLEKRTPRFNR